MSIKLSVYNQEGEKKEDISVSEKVFGVDLNEGLIYQAVVAQMSNKRQVLAHTKDRSEVRGGGRKPWRQKGTGRARAGSNSSPIWIGGGVTFGPLKTRNFSKKINKKMKQKALMMVLSDKVKNDNIAIVEELKMKEFKTKIFNEIISKIEKNFKKDENKKRSILIINDQKDNKIKYSGRNIPEIKVLNLENINIIDLLKYNKLILTKKAVEKIVEKYS